MCFCQDKGPISTTDEIDVRWSQWPNDNQLEANPDTKSKKALYMGKVVVMVG